MVAPAPPHHRSARRGWAAAALLLTAAVVLALAFATAPARASMWHERTDLSLTSLYDHLTLDSDADGAPNWYASSGELFGALLLSRDARNLYLLNHVEEEIVVMSVNGETGALRVVQTVHDVEIDVRGVWRQYGRSVVRGGIADTADGLNVYVSTVDGLFPSLLVFARSPADGTLSFVEEVKDPTLAATTDESLAKQSNSSAVAVMDDDVTVIVTHGEPTRSSETEECLEQNPATPGHGPHMFQATRVSSGAPPVEAPHFDGPALASPLIAPLATIVAGSTGTADRMFSTSSPFTCTATVAAGTDESFYSLFVTHVPDTPYRYLRFAEGDPEEGIITSRVESDFFPDPRVASSPRGDAAYGLLRSSPDRRFLYAAPLNPFNTDPARIQILRVQEGAPGIPEPIHGEEDFDGSCGTPDIIRVPVDFPDDIPSGAAGGARRRATAQDVNPNRFAFDGFSPTRDTSCARSYVRADPRQEPGADWAADQLLQDDSYRAVVTDLCVSDRWVVAVVRSGMPMRTDGAGPSENGDYDGLPAGADPTDRLYGAAVVFERDGDTGELHFRQSVDGLVRPSSVACTDAAAWVAGPYGVRVLQFVEDPPRALEYSGGGRATLRRLAAMEELSPSVRGAVLSYSVSPPLPDGVALDERTGVISGAPLGAFVDAQPRAYTVVARNSGGVATAVVRLAVTDLPAACPGWTTPSATLTVGDAADIAWAASATGGAVEQYRVTAGSLPLGLRLDPATGDVSGTALAAAGATAVTVSCFNSAGVADVTATLTLTVLELAPAGLAYDVDSLDLRVGEPGRAAVPRLETGAAVAFSRVPSGALPAGLQFDTETGVFSGTPSAAAAETTYTVTATSAGSQTATTTLRVTVLPVPPSDLRYARPILPLVVGRAITALDVPSSGGGFITLYSISPALPAGSGLSFGTGSGAIDGAPVESFAPAVYTVTASNDGGSTSAELVISASELEPAGLEYDPAEAVAVRGALLSPPSLSPTFSGGGTTPGLSFSVTPPLPDGLSLGAADGVVSGTVSASAATGAAVYTVVAAYEGGAEARTLVINVTDAAPATLAYAAADEAAAGGVPLVLRLGEPVPAGTLEPALVLDGPVTARAPVFSSSPGLPPGLSVSAATGEVTGTPVAEGEGLYRVRAATEGGVAEATLRIRVVAAPPSSLSYGDADGSDAVLRVGVPAPRLVAEAAGHTAPLRFSVEPDLPPGLGLDPLTGEIGGTPQVSAERATHTVTATNSGGSASAEVSIFVRYQDPTNVVALQYAFHEMVVYEGAAVPTNTPLALPCPFDGCAEDVAFAVSGGEELPRGFRLNRDTGEISGTAPAAPNARSGTVISYGDGFSVTVWTTVLPLPPALLTYNGGATVSAVDGSALSAVPASQGTGPFEWAVHPALPAGLSLNAATGELSGTPAVPSPRATYSVTARNDGGAAETQLALEVLARAPALEPETGAAAVIEATVAGVLPPPDLAEESGAVDVWTISPPAPDGFSFDNSSGELTSAGAPAGAVYTYTHTVCATNSGGTACRDVVVRGDADTEAAASNATRAIQTVVTTMEEDSVARKAAISSLFIVFGGVLVGLLLLLVWRVRQPDEEALDMEMEALEEEDERWQRNVSRKALREGGVAASSSRANLEVEGGRA